MTGEDEKLREAIRQAWPTQSAGMPPSFAATWEAAVRRRRSRVRRTGLAAVAALAGIVVVAVSLQTQQPEFTYIDTSVLLDSTSWSAPSDALLPDYRFDIYQDMPTLLESTQSAGGSLL